MRIYSIGPTSRPFEPVRGANALRAEDKFMELHGGRGSRLVYLTVEWLGSRFDAAWHPDLDPPAALPAEPSSDG